MVISCTIKGEIKTKLTNIGLVKNPHFSGGLSYNSPINYNNELLNVHLSENCSRFDSFILLTSLSQKKNCSIKRISSWTTNDISIQSQTPFYIEYDGEILTSNNAQFGILKNKINVCKS